MSASLPPLPQGKPEIPLLLVNSALFFSHLIKKLLVNERLLDIAEWQLEYML